MAFRATILVILAGLLIQLVSAQNAAVKSSLESHHLVPDVIDAAPSQQIQIKYTPLLEVSLGNELTPTQVAHPPANVNFSASHASHHVLVMVDPDAPSRQYPTLRSNLHWLVVDIPGSDLAAGHALFPYAGSAPSEGSGLHRYAFFVFQQPAGGNFIVRPEDANLTVSRSGFNLKNFAKNYKLGEPIAANFFQAQFDESLRARKDTQFSQAVAANKIVPDVIDTVPVHVATVKYPNGELVLNGGELTPQEVHSPPQSIHWPAEPTSLYTLLFVDPDAPNREMPILRSFLHGLWVNIPGTDLSKSDVYAEYIGSGPPKDSGLHRYIFLVYKQSKHLSLTRARVNSTNVEGRIQFNVKQFAHENSLDPIPVAGAFFQAQYHD